MIRTGARAGAVSEEEAAARGQADEVASAVGPARPSDKALSADRAGGTASADKPSPLTSTSMNDRDFAEGPGDGEGEASLHRWSLERPTVAPGVEDEGPSGTGEGGGWVVDAPGVGCGERLVELVDGEAPGGGGGGAEARATELSIFYLPSCIYGWIEY